MKKTKQFVMQLAIALLIGITHEVEAQNWLTAGNNVTPGQYLGSQNNQPLNIRTSNIPRAQFTTGNALNSWLGNAGDGLRIFDPAGGGGNLDLFTSSNAGGNETHVRFGGSGQVSGQNNRLEFISTGASMGNYYSTFAGGGIHRFDRGETEYGRMGTNGYWRFGQNTSGPVFGGLNADRRLEVVDNTTQFRLTFSPNSTGPNTDFFSNTNGNLQIMPSGQRVGININANPTANLDVNGDVRIRNVQTATPNSILIGVNANGASDLNVRRLDFTGNANEVLLGNGTWGVAPNNITANMGVSRFGNGPVQLGDQYFLFAPTNTPLTENRQIRLNGNSLIFSGNGSVGIGLTWPLFPSEVLDVNGNARLRNVPIQGGESLILGLQNGPSVNDIELSRLELPNDNTQVLLGNGTWGAFPSGTGSSFSSCSGNVQLLENNKLSLNGFNLYFESDNMSSVGVGYACGQGLPGRISSYASMSPSFFNLAGSFIAENANHNIGISSIANGGFNTYSGWFRASGEGKVFGVRSETSGGTSNMAIYAHAAGGITNYSVYGIGAQSPNSYAAYFTGTGFITGGLWQGSDSTIKYQITTEQHLLPLIAKLRPVNYLMKTDEYDYMNLSQGLQHGFISQEVQTVFPELVKTIIHPAQYDSLGVEISPETEILGINYDGFISLNTQAIIELNRKVENQTLSDESLKVNVVDLENSLAKILELRGVTYDWSPGAIDSLQLDHNTHIGFIAQEVHEVDSLLTYTDDLDFLHVDYAKVVPVMVEAMQEMNDVIENQASTISDLEITVATQQNEINDLNARLTTLENCLSGILPFLCQMNHTMIAPTQEDVQEQLRSHIDIELNNARSIVLDQNVPNPFAETTTINFSIPESVQRAQIHFYDASGNLIKTVDINERGEGKINVFAQDLSSGVYTYSLVADGKHIASKRMVKQ